MCVCAQGISKIFFYKGNRGVYLSNLRKKFLFKIEKKIQILSRLGEKKKFNCYREENRGTSKCYFSERKEKKSLIFEI